MSRAEQLHEQLQAAEERRAIRGYYSYSPGDRGRRWVIEAPPGESMVGTWSLTTREAEVFVGALDVGERAGWRGAHELASQPPPDWVERLDFLELRREARRVIGEDRVPLEALQELVASYSPPPEGEEG